MYALFQVLTLLFDNGIKDVREHDKVQTNVNHLEKNLFITCVTGDHVPQDAFNLDRLPGVPPFCNVVNLCIYQCLS